MIDDSIIMRSILQSIIDASDGFTVVGTADGADVGRRLVAELKPDIVTMDLEMPGLGGMGLLDEMNGHPHPAIVIVSASTRRDTPASAQALAHGAVACFDKARVVSDAASFLRTLRGAAAGKSALPDHHSPQ